MERSGHVGCWLLLFSGVAYSLSLGPFLTIFLASVGVPFTFLPDQDIKFGNHRGVTHSLFFAAIVTVLAVCTVWLIWGFLPPIIVKTLAPKVGVTTSLEASVLVVVPVLGGLLTHYLADVITMSGIPLLWPKEDRYALKLCYSKSNLANGAFQMVGVVSFLLALWRSVPS